MHCKPLTIEYVIYACRWRLFYLFFYVLTTKNSHLAQGPKHYISSKNKCAVMVPGFLCLSELFRRNLNEVKAVYVSKYYLACHFVIKTLRLHLKFRLTLLTINSHRGGEKEKRDKG